jgi:TRAP-type C4-dicarboxylate transport system substrate-binding protein
MEVVELPFIAARRGVVNAKATQELYETQLKEEFREVHPICLWSHDHGLVHANKQVKTMEDLKGLKLRSPTRQAAEALRALGASPIAMPVPQVPESLAQRVIDGAVIPWEVVPALKVHELVKFHTEIPGSPTLYTASFILGMNKAKYEGLPADLKAAIDKNSGQVAAEAAGRMWDEQAVVVSEMVKKRGNTITTLTEDEARRWQQATKPVIDAWIASVKDKGLDGAKLLESFRGLVAKYDKTV